MPGMQWGTYTGTVPAPAYDDLDDCLVGIEGVDSSTRQQLPICSKPRAVWNVDAAWYCAPHVSYVVKEQICIYYQIFVHI